MNIKEIKDLIKLVNETELTEVHIETDVVKLTLRKSANPTVIQAPVTAALPASGTILVPSHGVQHNLPSTETVLTAEDDDDDEVSDDHLLIASPMVGTFYRAPAPGAPSFVEVGSVVKQGQPVCIIEAMKLMNEIESEVSGRIVKILVEDAQPVEYGQPLFVLEKV